MAEVNMSGVTYGRNTAGAKSLLSTVQNKISSATKVLKGQAYTQVINTVKKYWSGADADKFLSEFESAVTEIQASYKKYIDVIAASIENDAKSFANMQQTNADTINR